MPLHVLIVDDSNLQRRILSASPNDGAFRVTEREAGHDALEGLPMDSPDLVLRRLG